MGVAKKEIMSESELVAALAECTAQGLIDYQDDTHFDLSEKGEDIGFGLIKQMPPRDRVLMVLMSGLLVGCSIQADREVQDDEW